MYIPERYVIRSIYYTVSFWILDNHRTLGAGGYGRQERWDCHLSTYWNLHSIPRIKKSVYIIIYFRNDGQLATSSTFR
jgi:hypothetical protein